MDCHTHVVRRDAPLASLRHSSPAADATVEDLLAHLDRHGLSHAVVTAPSFYGYDNSLLLDALARGRRRLIGTAHVLPTTSKDELAELAALGVGGLRLNWWQRSERPDPRDQVYRRFFTDAAAMGLHIEVLIEPRLLADVAEEVLAAGASLVVDHFGLIDDLGAPSGQALTGFLDTGRVWVKLSAPYRLASPGAAPRIARQLYEYRADRLLWGSDWPWVSHEHQRFAYGDMLAQLDQWLPQPHQREQVLVHNPSLLFAASLSPNQGQ